MRPDFHMHKIGSKDVEAACNEDNRSLITIMTALFGAHLIKIAQIICRFLKKIYISFSSTDGHTLYNRSWISWLFIHIQHIVTHIIIIQSRLDVGQSRRYCGIRSRPRQFNIVSRLSICFHHLQVSLLQYATSCLCVELSFRNYFSISLVI